MAGTVTAGSAAKWGPLWGARPRDWGASEEQQRPTYEMALSHLEYSLPPRRVVAAVAVDDEQTPEAVRDEVFQQAAE